jgi:hypothetical protein
MWSPGLLNADTRIRSPEIFQGPHTESSPEPPVLWRTASTNWRHRSEMQRRFAAVCNVVGEVTSFRAWYCRHLTPRTSVSGPSPTPSRPLFNGISHVRAKIWRPAHQNFDAVISRSHTHRPETTIT